MRVFGISMGCPHATKPTILVDVALRDEVSRAEGNAAAAVWGGHGGTQSRLWIPALNTWSLDTTRMLFWELSAYVPPEPDHHKSLLAGVRIGGRRRAKMPQDVVDTDVEFFVISRGWRASINPRYNRALATRTEAKRWRDGRFPSGRWSEPMRAALLELAEKSPVALVNVREELPGDASHLGLKFTARHTIQEGVRRPLNSLKGNGRDAQ